MTPAVILRKYFAPKNAIHTGLWALILGGVATLPVLASADLIWIVAMLILPFQPETILAFVYAAIPEEICKTLVLVWFLKRLGCRGLSTEQNSLLVTTPSSITGYSLVRSPLFIGFLLGLGFAVVELAIYFVVRLPTTLAQMTAADPFGQGPEPVFALSVMAVRVLTAVPLHAGVTALAACYWTAAAPVRAWLIPIALHGFYDLAILQAARGGGLAPLLLAYAVLALLAAWVTAFHAWMRPLSAPVWASTAQAEARPSPL